MSGQGYVSYWGQKHRREHASAGLESWQSWLAQADALAHEILTRRSGAASQWMNSCIKHVRNWRPGVAGSPAVIDVSGALKLVLADPLRGKCMKATT